MLSENIPARVVLTFRLPHMDTVDDVLRDLAAEELENLRVAMVRLLLDK